MSTRYVTPNGAGSGDGTTKENAAPFSSLQYMHDNLTHGDDIELLADVEFPPVQTPFNWSKRIAVHGRRSNGEPAYALLDGTRTQDWPANGVWTDGGRYAAAAPGSNVFHYKDAAAASGGTTFSYLSFRNVGTPFRPLFDSASVMGAITLDHVRTQNTNGLVYVETSSDGQCAITASNCRSRGYSEGMFRAFNDIIITDCYGDAMNQFHSPTTNLFGFHVQDAIVGVTTRKYKFQGIRCGYVNHAAAPPAGSSKDPATTGNYLQGDGGTLEENTLILPSRDLLFAFNGDRGLDLKAAAAEGDLSGLYAYGNNFNIGVHNDLVETWIVDSYLGPTFSAAYRSDKSACLQGSGHAILKRCFVEQAVPSGQAASKYFLAYATGQGQHQQSGVTIPNRVGNLELRSSLRRLSGGAGLKALASIGFGTPSYTEFDVAAVA